jgi:hypothetical protein
MKQPIRKYGGVIIGSLYGLAMRFLFEIGLKFDFADLFSVTFIWIVPIIIGITPMLFATDEQLASPRYRLTLPALTVCLFFLICFITRLEDILCIAIIAIPFILSAAIGGLLFAEILQKYKKNKKNITYSIFFIPILAGLAESELPTPTNVYEIKTTVVIENTPDNIWENIVTEAAFLIPIYPILYNFVLPNRILQKKRKNPKKNYLCENFIRLC